MAEFSSARRCLPLALPSGSIDHSAPTQSRGFFPILDDGSKEGEGDRNGASHQPNHAKRPDDFLSSLTTGLLWSAGK